MLITRTIPNVGNNITVGSTGIIAIILVAKLTMTISVNMIDITVTVVESFFCKFVVDAAA